jgi:hypothetical protein
MTFWWTGRGWTVPFTAMAGPAAVGVIVASLFGRDLATAIRLDWPVAFLAGAVANYLIARRFNRVATPLSREWRSDHDFMSIAMQWWTPLPVLVAILGAARAAGIYLGLAAGWAALGGLLALGLGIGGWVVWQESARRALRAEQSTRRTRHGTGKPIHISRRLRLSPAAAAEGPATTLRIRNRAPCRRCHGYGAVGGRGCRRCGGDGLGARVGEWVRVRIPAGCRDEQTLRIPGRGVPGMGRRPDGDLLLEVRAPRQPGTLGLTRDRAQRRAAVMRAGPS